MNKKEIKNYLNIIPYNKIDKKGDITRKKNAIYKLNYELSKNELSTKSIGWKYWIKNKFPKRKGKLNEENNHMLLCGNYISSPYQVIAFDFDVEKNKSMEINDIKQIMKELDIKPFQIIKSVSGGYHSIFISDNKNTIKGTGGKLKDNLYPALNEINQKMKRIDICGNGKLLYYPPTEFREGKYELIYETSKPKIESSEKLNQIIKSFKKIKRG